MSNLRYWHIGLNEQSRNLICSDASDFLHH
jgi:hypothetical protein